MSYIVAGRLEELPPEIRQRLGIFRHKVFVQRLHWEIPGVGYDSMSEWDEFDGGATVHLVALSAKDEVCGCARLMPTTESYLLGDVFPQLAGPGSHTSSPSVWEMSRFAGSGVTDHRTGSASGMSLFPYVLALALSFGATRVIGVVSRSVARLYRRYGLDLRDLAIGMAPCYGEIIACSIDLGPETFHNLQCTPVSLLSSITRFGHLSLSEAGGPAQIQPADAGGHPAHTTREVSLATHDKGTVCPQAAT